MYKAIIAIGILAAASLVAGCGGTSDETATAAVSKAQFVQQARAICEEKENEIKDAGAAWEKETGKKLNFEVLLRQILGPLLKQEAKELRSLSAPVGEEEKIARMIENLSKGAAAYATEGTKLKSTSSIDTFQREAGAYGLKACWI